MQLRKVLEREQEKLKVSWEVIEQDYILSWVLLGISAIEELRTNLVFKGGTALKKLYFGNYRFSQDLDFTSLPGAPKGNRLEILVYEACKYAETELRKRIPNPEITSSRYIEKKPHPNGQEAFVIRAQLPWHRFPYVRIMVEVTNHQKIVNIPIFTKVIHGYPENFNCDILAYTLEEIFAEKLQAILDNTKKLHERGWSRSRARDYYDLWRMIHSFHDQLDNMIIKKTLAHKSKERLTFYKTIDDFFDPLNLDAVQKDWDQWLAPIIYPLPPYTKVISELRDGLRLFLK